MSANTRLGSATLQIAAFAGIALGIEASKDTENWIRDRKRSGRQLTRLLPIIPIRNRTSMSYRVLRQKVTCPVEFAGFFQL
jgi:hypothetical protein